MTDRRKLVKLLSVAGAAGAIEAWRKPVVNSVTLPAHAGTSGAGCIQFTGSPFYVDFNNGNYVSSDTIYFQNNLCTSEAGEVGCSGFAYAPDGLQQAHAICQDNAGVDAEDQGFLNDIYSCGCGAAPSDVRLKTDIQSLGRTQAGFSLYRYKYLSDQSKTEYVGVMAQDLIETHPQALVIDPEGYYRVRYDLLGMRMRTYDDWIRLGMNETVLIH